MVTVTLNRAFVVFEAEDAPGQLRRSPGIWLGRHGGPESVYAFVQYLDARDVPLADPAIAAARFTQVVGNFLGATPAIGLHNIGHETDLLKWQAEHGVYLFRHDRGAPMAVSIRRIVYDDQQGGNRWLPQTAVAEELARARQHSCWQAHDADGRPQTPILTEIARRNDRFFCPSPDNGADGNKPQ